MIALAISWPQEKLIFIQRTAIPGSALRNRATYYVSSFAPLESGIKKGFHA
jgi:hypothetical protein